MNNSEHIITNFIWRFLERCGAQGVTLLVSIILGRLLDPDVYGMVSMITVITSLLQIFIDGGFSVSLIQKKDADDLDFSSVFYFNIVTGSVLYLLLFLAAPLIASFYKMPGLTPMIRVLGVTLLISALKSVQQAYVSRHMLFRKFFFSTLGGTIGAAVIGIVLAYRGFGPWALIAQQLFNLTVDTLILWIIVKWRPIRAFSFARLRTLLRFGWKLLVSSLLETGYNELRELIIGRMYTSADLAFYNRGKQFPHSVIININSSLDSVLLPSMANEQDNVRAVKEMTRRAIKIGTYVIMPIMMGLAVCAKPLISLLLTDKWLPAVPYLRIFCFTYAFYTIHTANLNAIKALGRSDLFLRLEIMKKVVGLVLLLLTMWWSPLIMAYSLLLSSILSQIINAWPNRKLLGYTYLEQVIDMLPHIGLSCLMGVLVWSVTLLRLGDLLTLAIQIPLGVLVYLTASKLFRLDSFEFILSILKSFSGKVKKRF